MKVGRYNVELSNQDKVWFTRPKITKGDIVEYYVRVAPHMLEYTKDRPLTMHRFPDGISKEGFYHKNVPDYYPKWIARCPIKSMTGEVVNYVEANNAATLVYIVNQGCITPHLFLSKSDKLDYPDQMIFDLDPPGDNFTLVRHTALALQELLHDIGLIPFVKTTGSRGLHVVVPLVRKADFDEVRSCAHDIATVLVEQDPHYLTLEVRKAKRHGKLFVDIMRNAFGQTAVAPFAVRARPGAPVATPLWWDEVGDTKLRSDRYTIKTIFKRLSLVDDPWHDMKQSARSIIPAKKKIKKMD